MGIDMGPCHGAAAPVACAPAAGAHVDRYLSNDILRSNHGRRLRFQAAHRCPRRGGRRGPVRTRRCPRAERAARAGRGARGRRSPCRLLAALLRQPAAVLARRVQLDARAGRSPETRTAIPARDEVADYLERYAERAPGRDPDQHPRGDGPSGGPRVRRRDGRRPGAPRRGDRRRQWIVLKRLSTRLPGPGRLHRAACCTSPSTATRCRTRACG